MTTKYDLQAPLQSRICRTRRVTRFTQTTNHEAAMTPTPVRSSRREARHRLGKDRGDTRRGAAIRSVLEDLWIWLANELIYVRRSFGIEKHAEAEKGMGDAIYTHK